MGRVALLSAIASLCSLAGAGCGPWHERGAQWPAPQWPVVAPPPAAIANIVLPDPPVPSLVSPASVPPSLLPASRLPPSLEPAPPAPRPARYALLPDVMLSEAVSDRLASVAEAYHRRTGRELVVTSGTRDPEHQAEAMHDVLRLGGRLMRTYRNQRAAAEIEGAYARALVRGLPPSAVVAEMASVIRRQMEGGVYISAHLRAGAADVRSRGMSAAERRAFLEAAAEVGGFAVIDESTPPHFHLQLDGGR